MTADSSSSRLRRGRLLRHDYEKYKGALEREVTLHLALIRVVREREKRESRKGGAKSVCSYVRPSNTLLQGLLNSDDKVVQCLLDHLTYLLTYLLRHDYEKHKGLWKEK